LDSGRVSDQAEIARYEGLSRARVTQIMKPLNLAPEIQDHILNLPKTANRPPVTERALRQITLMENPKEQLDAFREPKFLMASN
jgi:ParB-like chromosome segregation protein Spo0J